MKSPFPGMDPYLENHWGDVHTRLMVYASNQINAQLPDDLQVRVEESLAVEVDEQGRRTVYPDVQVVEESGVPSTETSLAAVAIVAKPYVLMLEDEPRTERHIEIVDTRDGGRVVTAIEVLSPANKVGQAGRLKYQRKQRQYLDAGISLVEIDLLREGDFVLAVPQERIPPEYRPPYLICIRRAVPSGRIELYRAPLREPLPNIPIPLRPTDRDVVLQVQSLIDDCYRDGRYRRIDYRTDPVPRLSEADACWADALLRENGLR
ncbi:MAG: DUF4058 family protein [Planctomycetota bacterium]|nr:DUF4058 family protein [Planctomycetota bacterium]